MGHNGSFRDKIKLFFDCYRLFVSLCKKTTSEVGKEGQTIFISGLDMTYRVYSKCQYPMFSISFPIGIYFRCMLFKLQYMDTGILLSFINMV